MTNFELIAKELNVKLEKDETGLYVGEARRLLDVAFNIDLDWDVNPDEYLNKVKKQFLKPVKNSKTVRITYVIEQEIDENINLEELSFKSYEDFYFFYSYKLKELQAIKIESLDQEGNVIEDVQNIYDF